MIEYFIIALGALLMLLVFRMRMAKGKGREWITYLMYGCIVLLLVFFILIAAVRPGLVEIGLVTIVLAGIIYLTLRKTTASGKKDK